MSLLALLMTLFLTMSAHTIMFWHAAENQQEACAEGRALLQMMTNDLHSSLFLKNSFFIDLPTTDPTCQKNLFFLTKISSSQIRGDLCAVGYFLVAEPKSTTTYRCYRFTASSEETLQALQKGTLFNLYATASSVNSSHCEQLASFIMQWQITPAWSSCGHLLQYPLSDHPFAPPALIELSVTTDRDVTQKVATLSTVVALPPES